MFDLVDLVRLPNSIEPNPWIESSIFVRSIYYAGISVHGMLATSTQLSYVLGRSGDDRKSRLTTSGIRERNILALDCSQSPIASETGESTKCPWVGLLINPTTPTQGHFVLSPVSLASRDHDDGPVELNDRHLRSHGKIGDCEQSILAQTLLVNRLLVPVERFIDS